MAISMARYARVMAGTITSGPGFLPKFGGRHAVRGRAMQDDDEKYRAEKEQGRHQNQPTIRRSSPLQGGFSAPGLIWGDRFHRRLYLQFGKRLIW